METTNQKRRVQGLPEWEEIKQGGKVAFRLQMETPKGSSWGTFVKTVSATIGQDVFGKWFVHLFADGEIIHELSRIYDHKGNAIRYAEKTLCN